LHGSQNFGEALRGILAHLGAQAANFRPGKEADKAGEKRGGHW